MTPGRSGRSGRSGLDGSAARHAKSPTPRERRRIVVTGVVQGVGFRPFVAKLAEELRVGGHCGNDEVSVFVEAEGSPQALDELVRRIVADAPPLAVVVDVRVELMTPHDEHAFSIVASRSVPGARTLVPPDVATCPDCLAELADRKDRRYRHPFITCTNCGPRFTIITDLPYDRPATTMAGFEMCSACRREYVDRTDRRYHAQPISCHDCGPRLWLEDGDRRVTGDDDVLAAAQEALAAGKIVAVKGVGGFHLACSAANPAAVALLRRRKRRPTKPFAVMVPDLERARTVALVSDEEANLLTRPSRPIVLLTERPGLGLAADVAPGTDELGLLLPYAPLHHLLFSRVPGAEVAPPTYLVMTSGNLSDEPLCYTDEDARARLGGIADVFLMHNREIAVPCEDSVVAHTNGAELPIRRSRGYAPLPVSLGSRGPVTLAVGAEVKNTFCLTRDSFAFCSAHLGDMGSLESQTAFARSVDQLITLHAATPELVVADDHPGYCTRAWAESYSERQGIPLLTVQHHHAHVAALLAEHGRVGTPVLGVAYDGTGYGCDRTVWGGELLLVGPDITSAERVGHLQAFQLPGGDAAVRNPFRVALALLHLAGVDHHEVGTLRGIPEAERNLVWSQLQTGTGCVTTTSAGRLFDGVSALLGVCERVGYEAQAAIELEALARTATSPADLVVDESDGVLGLSGLVRDLVARIAAGEPRAGLALGFHLALARATVAAATRLATRAGISTVGLTGGVFQNRILLAEVSAGLEASSLEVLTHRLVPPNDGGLSLGQAVVGQALAASRQAATGEPALVGQAGRGVATVNGGG